MESVCDLERALGREWTAIDYTRTMNRVHRIFNSSNDEVVLRDQINDEVVHVLGENWPEMRRNSGVVVGDILLDYYRLLLRAMPAMELRVPQENVVDSTNHHQEDLRLMGEEIEEEEEEDLGLMEEEEEEAYEYYADMVDFLSRRNDQELSEETILNQLQTRINVVGGVEVGEEEKICCVCQEDLYGGEGRIATLHCNHDYHVHCIIDWLRRGRNFCPLCRAVAVSEGNEWGIEPLTVTSYSGVKLPVRIMREEKGCPMLCVKLLTGVNNE